jgi:hypothetical protein
METKPTLSPRPCAHCGNDFTPKRAHAVYCSGSCRAKASNANSLSKAQTSPEAPSAKVPAKADNFLSGFEKLFVIPPHAQMMIDINKKEAERWEKNFEEEKKKREAAEQELKEMKLAKDRQDNPGGLQGFIQSNPTIAEKALEIFGPGLAAMMQKGLPAPGMAGVSEQGAAFNEWYARLTPETKEQVWSLLVLFMQQEDAHLRNYVTTLLMSIHQQHGRTGS